MNRHISISGAHSGPIHTSEFSHSSQCIFTGGQDRKIKIWNSSTGKNVATIKGHAYEVLDVKASHDDLLLASCGGDRKVYLWDPSVISSSESTTSNAKSPMVQILSGHISRVNSVCFSENNNILASGSYDATVRLWDCRRRGHNSVQKFTDANDSISSVSIADHYVYSGSVDGCVRIYDIRMGQLFTLTMGKPGNNSVTSVTPSVEGPHLVLVSTLDSTIRLMDSKSAQVAMEYRGHVNNQFRTTAMFVNFKESQVATVSEDGAIVMWDTDSGNLTVRENMGPDFGYSLSGDSSGQLVATSTLSGNLDVWRIY